MRRFSRFVLLAFVLVAIGSVATHELASAAAPPYTIKMALVSDASACATAAVSASASGSIPNDNGGTVKYLCAEASDSTGAVVPSAPITFSVSLGVVSTGTAKTIVAFTGSNGRATTQYRVLSSSGALAGATDTAIASNSGLLNAVGTINIQIVGGPTPTPTPVVTPAPTPTAPVGGDGTTRVAFLPSGGSCVGASFAQTSSGTIAPGATATFCAQPLMANGTSPAGQVLLLTTSAGRLVLNGFTGNGSPSITGTTDSNGIVSATYTAPSSAGLDNLIAQNVSTTQANGLVTLTVGSGSSTTPTPTSTSTAAPTATSTPSVGAWSNPPGFDITVSATPVTSVTSPGGYGREISVIKDGLYPTAGGSGAVYDTF